MLIDGVNLTETSTIENAIVASGTSFPVGSLGEMFYRSDLNELYVYDGAAWNTVSAASAPAAAYISASFPGNIGTLDSKSRWSPPRTITLKSVTFNIDTTPTNIDVQLDIRKNGVSMIPGVKPKILIGTFKNTVPLADLLVTADDYITLDIITGSGADMTVRIDYI